ncbi:UDP-glucose 4-epimerase GalE [Roseibacterium sp. SDUM158016]|uniref:UDP-glucose 4-epimerase GalE n=1 Tax=Roseicyclus sediminis TaxID=2980997 RepID=UPI0021CED0F9|nr:UDP-glucose 4-epimerase GalE [Roseibacterium sp. SDUM158016]MCU4652382.1 UDP-glucose 4-epimerase GalE [Roseibacterium sp. SDUM158016]
MAGRRILLTGGAGYIGSHTFLALAEAGHDVVILDNFVNARRSVVDRLAQIVGRPVEAIDADVRDAEALEAAFRKGGFEAVVHFAALKAVSESVEKPLDYFDVNIGGLMTLLRVMEAHDCRRLVFSSSATVYGVPDETPTPETADFRAMNPYGHTKIMGEQILNWLSASDPRWAIGALRYFNPAGAHGSAMIGEDPRDIPNNLFPFIAKVATGELSRIRVFGNDYDTPDGTGVRDYIHVEDLARGHALSLDKLFESGEGHLVNLGTGRGYSVLEVIAAYKRASNRDLPFDIVDRRPGDVPIYVASAGKAAEVLGFRTERTLDEMCASSWAWISGPHSEGTE